MRFVIYFILIASIFSSCSNKIVGIYRENITSYKVSEIHFLKDKTYKFVKVNPYLSIRSEGKWRMINDTLVELISNEQPPVVWYDVEEVYLTDERHVKIQVRE